MRVRFMVAGAFVTLAMAASAPAVLAADGAGPGGGGPGGGAAGGRARPELTDEQKAALADFRACMADHGVTLPDPGSEAKSPDTDTELPDADTLTKAYDACRDKIPPPTGVSEQEFRAHQDAVAKFQGCLTDNGASSRVRIPGLHHAAGETPEPPSEAERAQRKAAFDACADLRPDPPDGLRGPGGGPGGGPGLGMGPGMGGGPGWGGPPTDGATGASTTGTAA